MQNAECRMRNEERGFPSRPAPGGTKNEERGFPHPPALEERGTTGTERGTTGKERAGDS
jgi:hypothetical protein